MGGSRPAMREAALVLAATALVFFLNLGGIALWDEDEPKNAVCAREMLSRNDWIVPTFNGQLRTDKPILLYWLMLLSYRTFGVTEFAARFWSAALATITVLATYDLGRRVGPPRMGLWSGVILSGSLLFGVSARAATPDATLIVCVVLAAWAYVKWAVNSGQWAVRGTGVSQRLPWGSLFLVYGFLGLAVLAKGPSGFVLPLAVMILFVTLRRRQALDVPACRTWSAWLWGEAGCLLRCFGAALRSLRVVAGTAISLVVAVPWYVSVGLATDWAWPLGFLGKHNVQRFIGPLEGHSGPIVYYVPALLIGLAPWSLWLWPALKQTWNRWTSRGPDSIDLFLLSWIAVYVGVFSLAGTKLPSYVLPCYPAFALLMGRYVAEVVARKDVALEGGPFVLLSLLGGGLLIGLGAAGAWIGPNLWLLGLIGAVPLGAGLIGWHWARSQRPLRAMGVFATAAVVLLAGLFGVAADAIDDQQTPVVFARQIRAAAATGTPVATLDAFRPTLVFYVGETVTDCPTPQDAADFLKAAPGGFLVTRDDQWPHLEPLLPPEVRVVARERMFLRKFDLLLISRTRRDVAHLVNP